jgi:hypothetical protein
MKGELREVVRLPLDGDVNGTQQLRGQPELGSRDQNQLLKKL